MNHEKQTVATGSRLVQAHLFAFGGPEQTARWREAVIAGRFTPNDRATGFEIWPE